MDIRLFASKKPTFASIIETYGHELFFTYLSNELSKQRPILAERKKEFVQQLELFLKRLALTAEAAHIIEALQKTWTVATADHHGVLWHPFFSNANLIHARYLHNINIPYAIVFACSGTSFGNSSYPRSIGFHDDAGTLQHLQFVSASMRNKSIYGTPAIDQKRLDTFMGTVELLALNETKRTFIKSLIHDWSSTTSMTSISFQFTHMTKMEWGHVPENLFARLAYLPLEEFVVHLLCNLDPRHYLWQMITTGAGRYCAAVTDIQGAHAKDTTYGSMIFWRRNKSGNREALVYDDGFLLNKDAEYKILCTRDAIIQELQNGTLYPTLALSLIILSCYYGINCMGGYSQVGYLAKLHDAWTVLTKESAASNPSIFCADFAFDTSGKTLLDMITEDDFSALARTIDTATLRELIEPMLPELYKIIA